MTLKELFQNSKSVLADGAMGTYFSKLTGLSVNLCELYNIKNPDIIRQIHSEYISAGARLIRTNTFSANSFVLGVSHNELSEIIKNGYNIAVECAGNHAVVCADISAIYENSEFPRDIFSEYKFISDIFIGCGAKTFIFETLSDLTSVLPAIDYIIEKLPEAEIIVSFTIMPDGYTRSGNSIRNILNDIELNSSKLKMVGLNCGCGTSQLYQYAIPFFSYIQKKTDLLTIVLPNAGYPSNENQRTVFTSTPIYFSQQTSRFIGHNISAIGGCCGTEPEYIKTLGKFIRKNDTVQNAKFVSLPNTKEIPRNFSSRLSNDKFVIAVELDPPNNADLTKIINAAKILKESNVDIITVSDSPLGHTKMDPVICSARIKRETGIEVLPHICCRDRNINALRSIIYGAYSEGIRAILAVTGDHIAETDRGVVKPVFNLGSVQLMSIINKMNEDLFLDSPITIGGAFDPTPKKAEFALERVDKKISSGAKFLLTQPVFSKEVIPIIEAARQKGIRVLVGIMPMVSYRNANFMKNEVPGINVPQKLVERFSMDMTKEQSTAVGIEIAVEIAEFMYPHADGFYFMTPFNRAEVISAVLENIKSIIKVGG